MKKWTEPQKPKMNSLHLNFVRAALETLTRKKTNKRKKKNSSHGKIILPFTVRNYRFIISWRRKIPLIVMYTIRNGPSNLYFRYWTIFRNNYIEWWSKCDEYSLDMKMDKLGTANILCKQVKNLTSIATWCLSASSTEPIYL